MPDRVISVPQATQIATKIKNKFDKVNGRLDDEIADVKQDLAEYNAYDILRKIGTFSNGSSQGVSYTWNADKTECTITGTATGSSFKVLCSVDLPSELKADEKYPVLFESPDGNISLELIAYLNGATSGGTSTYIRYPQDYEVPKNCTRILARLRVKSGSTVNAIVKVAIINTQTNKQLSDDLKKAVGTIPTIDSTLTTAGSAADAKIVGDKFKQVFGYNGELGVNDNLNTLIKPGFYAILNGNYPANYPFTNAGGRLLVVKSVNENSGSMQWQLLIVGGIMKYRYSVAGTTWTDWKTTANIDDIPSADSIVKYNPFYTHNINSTVPTLDEEKISGGYSDYVSTIYGFWDDLMSQYPQFITKEELTLPDDIVQSLPDPSGYDNGATVMIPDGDGYVQYRLVNGAWVSLHTWRNGAEYNIVKMSKKIYAYTISPYKDRTNRDKILWISGLHGHEKMTHIATCYMFKELLDRYSIDEELSHFLVKNDIVVIPIADVSGSEGTYGTHGMTENYVNPNRDYPTNWEESQNEYNKTGNYPAYDPYTRVLMNYISSFNNVSYLVNKHDSSDLTSAKYIGYFVDNLYPFPYKYEVRVFDQLDAWLRFRYGWIYTDFIGSTWNPDSVRLLRNLRTESVKGTLNQWTNSLGIAGGLFEISGNSGNDFATDHTSDFPKIHAELSLNFLSGIIKYLESSI
jgi:hypothetical protein